MSGETPTSSSRSSISLIERLQKVEWEQEAIEKRLREGAAAFASVRDSIDDVREQIKPKPVPTWKVIAASLSALALIGGWIWQAAQYPNRDEFEAVRSESAAIKIEQVRIQADLRSMRESQTNIETNLRDIAKDVNEIARARTGKN